LPRTIFIVIGVAVALVVAGLLVATCRDTEPRHAATPTDLPAPGEAVPAPAQSSDEVLTFVGRARSLETTAPVPGLQRLTLAGAPAVTVSSGPIEVSGPQLTVIALKPLTVSSRLVVSPRGTTMTDLTYVIGDARIEGGTSGPVTVKGQTRVVTTGTAVQWLDAPATIDLANVQGRQDVSWAGSSSVRGLGLGLAPQWTGIRTHSLTMRIERKATEVDVTGTADPAQVYAEGQPQLRTTMSINRQPVKDEAAEPTVAPGHSGFFTWRLSNTGNHTDLNVMRLRAASPAAGWVALGLESAPPFWGGEAHPPVGGETPGLRRGSTIDATLGRGHGETRAVTFNVPLATPPGRYPISIVLEGNFTPVTFTVTVVVT
jgi:hypothetical protein